MSGDRERVALPVTEGLGNAEHAATVLRIYRALLRVILEAYITGYYFALVYLILTNLR